MQFICRAFERLAELRISDGDQAARAFGESAPVERGDAIFRHNIVDVSARSRDGCTWIENGHDARDFLFNRREHTVVADAVVLFAWRARGRWQRDNRASIAREGRAA